MYDRNGLQLTPVQNTLNSYKFTAVDTTARMHTAYAQATRNRGVFSMVTIGKFKDVRDAAFVAQEFAKVYNEEQVYEMALDKTFTEVAKDFMKNLEIPEWQFPAEGLDWDDILGENGYKQNRVEDAREALVEAIKLFGVKVPNMSHVKEMINRVNDLYNNGHSFREAAKTVLNIQA